MSKFCKPCQRSLDESEFNVRRKSPDGLCVICRSCSAEKNRLWRLKNPDGFKLWSNKNKEKRSEYSAHYYEKNKESRAEYNKTWLQNNRASVYARIAKRVAAKIKATPSWADQAEIVKIYEKSVRMTKESGIRYEVDHYFPLRGKTVCGLHVETNLRVITRSENARKKNHMPREYQ